jgi:hypothetical protein
MQEALHSFNVKFKMQGFECQLTVRDEEQGTGKIVTAGQSVVRMLAGLVGVTPSNGNGKPQLPGMPEQVPLKLVCPVCGKDDELEAIILKNGKRVFKCQRCQKWLPDKK